MVFSIGSNFFVKAKDANSFNGDEVKTYRNLPPKISDSLPFWNGSIVFSGNTEPNDVYSDQSVPKGDKFILVYKDKDGENEAMESNSQTMAIEEHIRSYSELLLISKNIVFRGAPGTGKGTLSTLLSQYYDIPHISTGDILRDTIRRNDKDSEVLKQYMEAGHLIPDDFMFKIVETR